jgi:hypothetical protein
MTFEPLNMHTDLKIAPGGSGSITLTGKDKPGHERSVTLAKGIAHKVQAITGQPVGGGQPPHVAQANMHTDVAPANMHTDVAPGGAALARKPFNMHTDAHVKGDNDSIVITGPATHEGKDGELRVTIDGPALATLKGKNAGL